MMSPKQLERVSSHYRKGYMAGYQKKPLAYKTLPDEWAPFGKSDYEDGYQAGSNDRYWSDKRG